MTRTYHQKRLIYYRNAYMKTAEAFGASVASELYTTRILYHRKMVEKELNGN